MQKLLGHQRLQGILWLSHGTADLADAPGVRERRDPDDGTVGASGQAEVRAEFDSVAWGTKGTDQIRVEIHAKEPRLVSLAGSILISP